MSIIEKINRRLSFIHGFQHAEIGNDEQIRKNITSALAHAKEEIIIHSNQKENNYFLNAQIINSIANASNKGVSVSFIVSDMVEIGSENIDKLNGAGVKVFAEDASNDVSVLMSIALIDGKQCVIQSDLSGNQYMKKYKNSEAERRSLMSIIENATQL